MKTASIAAFTLFATLAARAELPLVETFESDAGAWTDGIVLTFPGLWPADSYEVKYGNTGNIQCLCVRIPLADGNPDSRVYAYEVVVIGEARSQKLFKAVYAAGCNMGIGHETNGGVTTPEIAKDELPPGKSLTFAVRPITSLGTSGRPIITDFKV